MQPTIAVDEYRDPDLDSSGSEADQPTSNPGGKIRRRLHGSCDRCRKRKVKCDSAIMPDKVCTNCIQAKTECTHAIPKRKKDRQQEQINQLEERVRELEEQLRLAQESNPGSSHKDPEALAKEEETDDFAYVALAEQMHSLDIGRLENKFFGKSSMFFLASQASKVREAFRQETDAPFKKVKRPEYWNISPWQHEYAYSDLSSYIFPEPDLMDLLLTAYWARVHIIYPLLHRPSFERDVLRGRHHTDEAFGRVVLLVLGCASRYVEDERVLLADESGYVGPSAGWCFVSQTPLYLRTTIIKGTDIIDLQFYALTALYYLGSSCPQTTYHLISLALGFVVEHGMHRRSPSPPNAKDELEKRVFWVLVTMDRFMSVWLGRPVTLREGDSFDAELPLDCDDEFWDTEVSDPSLAFVQPARRPSLISGFRLHIQLGEIADKMLNTLYSRRPATALDDVSEDQWTEDTVIHLDGLMNGWRDSLPQHLRWDPFTPNTHHLNQSTSLHATFYYLRIQIHRPLLSLKTPMALSSLAACSHAARACSNVVSQSLKRQRYSAPLIHNAVLVAAFVLSIGLCGRRGSKVPYETGKELEDIEKCLIFLREGERRWYTAGRAVDMILELVNLGDGRELFSNTKRPREWVPHDVDRRPPAPDGGSFGRRPSGQGLGISTNFSNVIPSIATGVHRRPSQIGATSPMLMNPPPRISTSGPYDLYQPQPQHATHLQLQDQNSCMVQPDPGTYAALAGLGFDDSVTSWNSAPVHFDVEQWERYLAELNANPFGTHDPRSVLS